MFSNFRCLPGWHGSDDVSRLYPEEHSHVPDKHVVVCIGQSVLSIHGMPVFTSTVIDKGKWSIKENVKYTKGPQDCVCLNKSYSNKLKGSLIKLKHSILL